MAKVVGVAVTTESMFRQKTLANGLQVVGEVHPAGYTASFGYFVKAGARDESDPVAGVSHFLEHMVFKGTARRSAAEVNRELDELGGQSNAYTSEEQTVYYATVLPKYQSRTVDLLTDIMRPTLREDDFETERHVILEEIAKYDDQPPFGGFERSMELYFGTHGLGRRVLGTRETIEALSPEQMRSYFERHYSPEAMVFAAAGNFDFDQLVEDLQRLTAEWQPQHATEKRIAPELTEHKLATERIEGTGSVQAYAIRLGPAPGANDPDRYPMRLLAAILGDDSGSRLFWELVDTGRTELAVSWTQEFDDCGIAFQYLVGPPETMERNLKLVDDILQRIAEDGVTGEELEQAINKTTASLVLRSERPSNRMFAVGNSWLVRGSYDPLDATIARYRAVTADDIRHVVARYGLQPRTQVVVGS